MLSQQKYSLFSMLHLVGLCSACLSILFVINNFLIFGFNAPGVVNILGLNKIFGVESLKGGYSSGLYIVGLMQTAAGSTRHDSARLDPIMLYTPCSNP